MSGITLTRSQAPGKLPTITLKIHPTEALILLQTIQMAIKAYDLPDPVRLTATHIAVQLATELHHRWMPFLPEYIQELKQDGIWKDDHDTTPP